MKSNLFKEQLKGMCFSRSNEFQADQQSTNTTQTSLEDAENSPNSNKKEQQKQTKHSSEKYKLPSDVGLLEIAINTWLDEQGIFMVDPAIKEERFFEKKRNNIWATLKNTSSSNNLSLTQICSQQFEDSSPKIKSPELCQLPKLSSHCSLNDELCLSAQPRKQSDSLFDRRKSRMKTMHVSGSLIKPSIYSMNKPQVHES